MANEKVIRKLSFLNFFNKIGLIKRMMLGYVFIIFLPVVIAGPVIYHNFYNHMIRVYSMDIQQLIGDAYLNFEVNLSQIEGIYNAVQYNTNITEYLTGYDSAMEATYNLLKYVRPLISNITVSNPFIKSVRIYNTNEDLVAMPPEVMNIQHSKRGGEIISSINFEAIWVLEGENLEDIELVFYKKIFNSGYTKTLGLLEVRMYSDVLKQLFDSINRINSGNDIVFLKGDQIQSFGSGIFNDLSDAQKEDILRRAENSNLVCFFAKHNQIMVNTISVSELGTKILIVNTTKQMMEDTIKSSYIFFAIIILLLIILSGVYLLISLSITTRITRLAKHMGNVNKKNLLPFHCDTFFEDEIQILISSYNTMINQIDELINNVHREEILRREAEYSALQAQIKPHFFNNTLEALRMMAESHHDFEVSDACYSFGRLMRYCLSSDDKDTVLLDEITNIEDYLKMYKLRMGFKFSYSISVNANADKMKCPRFILQPLAENSIVHGVSKTYGEGYISVVVKEDPEKTVITITDNGKGISEQRLSKINDVLSAKQEFKLKNSEDCFGIYNVNERVKAFFGQESGISYESKEGELTICRLELQKNIK